MELMRVLIAGGSGFLGQTLARAWRDAGDVVRILTRQPAGPDDIRWSADPADMEWSRALANTDVVINLAGASIAGGRWAAERKALIRDSRLRATRAIVEAINASRTPIALLSSSAIGYYGVGGDEPLSEAAPPGSDFLASLCRAWEERALEATAATRVVLLRTGLVLARHGGALRQMALPFQFGIGGRVGTGRQYMSWIHIDDWVGLVRLAAIEASLSGPLNLTAPTPVTNAEFAKALGHAMHRPAVMPAPGFAIRLILGEMGDALILGGQRVVPRRAQELGYRFRYPTLDAALRAIYSEPS
jgi:uncharacterized protein (TIGR01777 family)